MGVRPPDNKRDTVVLSAADGGRLDRCKMGRRLRQAWRWSCTRRSLRDPRKTGKSRAARFMGWSARLHVRFRRITRINKTVLTVFRGDIRFSSPDACQRLLFLSVYKHS